MSALLDFHRPLTPLENPSGAVQEGRGVGAVDGVANVHEIDQLHQARCGGVELVTWSDIVIAGENATFGLPEAKIGVWATVYFGAMPAASSRRLGARMALAGDVLGHQEAKDLGLATYAVGAHEVEATLEGVLDNIRAAAPDALARSKRWLNRELLSDGVPASVAALEELSDHTLQGPEFAERMAAFYVAKAARAAALEGAVDRIRVNAVAPGPVLWPDDDEFDELTRQRIVSHTLLRRVGEPDDVARALIYLLESPFVTGETLVVDVTSFNDKTLVSGHRHTEAMHVTERYRRTSYDTIEYEASVTDVNVFAAPVEYRGNLVLHPEWEIGEYVCAENMKDYAELFE